MGGAGLVPDTIDGDMTDENQVAVPAGEGESFGSWLRSQREVRQVELQTITQASKINIRYLEALEQDRFDLLPATIFVKGFLREYARIVGLDSDEVLNFYLVASAQDDLTGGIVGLDSDEVLNFYLVASAQDDLTGGIENLAKRSPRRSFGRTVVVVLALVAIALFLVWRSYTGLDGEAAREVETMAPPITEAVPPPPPPEPLAEQALRVTLEFRATSWVDVHSDGERTVSELRLQGESLTVTADEEIRLKLRNAEAATIEVNGETFEHEAGDDEEIVIAAPETPDPV